MKKQFWTAAEVVELQSIAAADAMLENERHLLVAHLAALEAAMEPLRDRLRQIDTSKAFYKAQEAALRAANAERHRAAA